MFCATRSAGMEAFVMRGVCCSRSLAATTVRYYRSTDGTITTSDTQVGTDVETMRGCGWRVRHGHRGPSNPASGAILLVVLSLTLSVW